MFCIAAQIADGTNDMLLVVISISVIAGFNSLQLSNICPWTSVSEHNHAISIGFDHYK